MVDRWHLRPAPGVQEVFLLTTTAEHYFPRFGFACIRREEVAGSAGRVEFQGACPASAAVMRKSSGSVAETEAT